MPDAPLDPCPFCDYDLRGLPVDRPCPECGEHRDRAQTLDPTDLHAYPPYPVRAPVARVIDDHPRWRVAFLLLACVVASLLVLQVGGMASTFDFPTYHAACTVLSILWGLAVWMVTPPILDRLLPEYWLVRRAVRCSQGLWAVGYVAWFTHVRPLQGTGAVVYTTDSTGLMLAHGGAWLGVIGLVVYLRHVAMQLELDDPARRFNLVAWGVAILGPIVWFLPWMEIATAGLGAGQGAFMIWWLLLIFVGPWFVLLGILAHACWTIHRSRVWKRVYERRREGREERIRRTRASLDVSASQQVRRIGSPTREDEPCGGR